MSVPGLDSYVKALIKMHVVVDCANRVFFKGNELEVIRSGNQFKVKLLPTHKFLISFEQLRTYGAKFTGVRTAKTMALIGAQARWRKRKEDLPSNVYLANARSIEYAQEHNKPIPEPKYIGRRRTLMTETFDTVDEVVKAMEEGRWRTEFRRGAGASKT